MRKSKKSRTVSARRSLQIESLENRVVMAADLPLAVNDVYLAVVDQPLDVATPGVFANDISASGNAMTAALFSGPEHGVLDLHADGTFAYTPEAGFEGLDSFVYLAQDGELISNLAAVSLHVQPALTPPISLNDAYSVNEDQSLDITADLGVLDNDTDAGGESLAASLVSGPAHGALVLNSDGSFEYTPAADFHGVDGFSYVVSDGEITSDVATVTINVLEVNDLPVAQNDEFSILEDSPLISEAGVLVNDSDVDGDALSVSLVSGPANGTLELNENGSFVYTPNANFHGVDGFSYAASDGTAESDVVAVTINVSPQEDVPVAASDEYTTDEDAELVIAAAGVLANDTDADGDPLTATLVAGPSSGTLALNSDGSFTYTPNADFNGVDSFSYMASDASTASEAVSVTINVLAKNDVPVEVNDEFTTDEDTPLVVPAAGVLANDVDKDGDPLAATVVAGPAKGSLELNEDGSFTYTPNANFNGVDGFSYTAGDGTAESDVIAVTINVAAINDVPVAEDDAYLTEHNTPLVISAAGVLANDTDAEGDALAATVVTGPANGTLALNSDGSFTYTPNDGYSGPDSFTYTAGDGTAQSEVASVSIVVNPAVVENGRPVAQNDRFDAVAGSTLEIAAPGLLANDSDPEGAPLTASLFTPPQHGTVAVQANGAFSYTPGAGFVGRDSFLYRVTDGIVHSALAAVTIYVQPAPAPAIAENPPSEPICPPSPCAPPEPVIYECFGPNGIRQRLASLRDHFAHALAEARTARCAGNEAIDAVMGENCRWM